ncbi:phage tail protein [Neisseria sp. CP9]|uniref:TipJ family phage tail tip protein n=1 Tax=Neisseria sp. CP9 TaxID=3388843 RepID=UPI0039F00280
MGGKSGGGQRTPYEAPNSLSSAQSLRIIDAVSEGVVSGFANGDDAPFKSVYFDDTPVQNSDGSYNFNGVTGYFQRGEQDQSYVPGFDASERTVAVSAAVKQNQPIVRAVTDELVSRLRITVAVERNAQVEDNGDTVPADTLMRVELINSNGVQASNQVRFNEKSSGTYYQDVEFDVVPQVPFNIRVFRISPDSKTDKVSNNTYFSSYVEIVDAKLSYPHTAFAALSIDSAQFGNQIPRRNYLMKGRLVKVPSNYNPETRQYTGGTWDGSFKTAWTNNPAWVFYDVLTQPRFSTLARRLNVADIDKWSLYQIGKYCDEPVDDGFGGKEPRFVCNAYITDLMQAGEFLNNLASVFTGLPVWNGQQVSVVMDADADPVAQYTNANVKDGLFNYAGAALKSIHTAVHVQYIDKYDGYRAKTEYVADNEAIARYGLNIKQITAFGCDSRGQAARFGAWTLQTELRQQNAVTFEIGREGLKHLPYDIVQIMDNQYAGAELSGRVAAISGNVLTLDRPVSDAVGALVFYSEGGSLKSAKITAAAGNKVTLEREVPLQAGDTWVLSGKVKPRLYRAIGIKENTDAGTYTVTALLHDPKKYAAVDSFAHFDHEITTLHNTAPVLTDAAVNTDGGTVVMTWDNLAANGQVLTYDIKIYRNNSLYRHIPDAQTAEIRLENLPNGNYRAEIRGRNARGVLSAPLVKAWSIDYAVTGLRTTPKTLSVAVDWVLPQTVVSELVSELWYSKTNNLQTATKLASLAYPQNSYTLTGVGVADVYYFWVRIRDIAGNTGEFTAAVQGRADNNPAPIVQQIQGAIGKSALSRELIDTLNRDMAAAAGLKVSAEAAERAKALQEEARARTAAIQAESSARTAELARKSSEIGTRIAATEAVNEQQAQQIQTVTSAQGNTAAGLEAEKKARTDGDRAEAQARETLAVRLGNAESGISALRETVTRQDAARASEINTLTAKLENVEVGGRNYALSTAAADKVLTVSGNNQTKSVTLDVSSSLDLKQGDALIIACDLDIVNATSMYGKPYPRIGVELSVTYSDNTIGYFSAWYDEAVKDAPKTLKRRLVAKHTVAKDVKAVRGLIVQARYQTSESIKVSNVKLERGTVATDWSPAPEDSNADASALSALSAELTAYKAAQVETDKAQTEEIRAAKAVASGNQAEITRLQTAKAEKDEVATIARSALSAEWKRDADNAKTAAVAAAVADAKVKADAAQAAAERAAQAKADAAQAAAAADAKNKSDAAKAAAIADAAAKDAQIKREAAADAKAKADKALADAKSYSDTASAKIDRLAETVSRNDAARSSEINTLTAKLENVEVGGRNYALSTAAADKVLTVSGNNQTKSVTLDVSSSLDLKQGDALIIACDLDIVNATSMYGKPYPRIGVELSVTYSDNTIGYFSAWYDEAVKDAPKTLKRRLVAKHTVAKDVKAVRGLIVQARYQTSESIKVSNVKLERGTVATDWSPAPEDSNADTSALSALSAKVQQASSAVAEIGGKIQSLYTLKTEAIAGGRRAVAGVALGADGKTGSGEILLMADKVAYVDPKDKTVTPAFVTVIENGRAKQALNGDLFASGSVLAKHLAANLTVEAPTLNGATVNAGLINGGTIRGARIEAVDLEAANIIGDVVAVRTFELKQSPLGYQELICQIPDSRKARRTVIVPPVFAVAENGAVVSLQLYMDGVIQREVTIQSPEKRIERNEKFSVWVPGGPPLYMRTPQDVPLSFSVPFHLPKIGSISFQKGIDGAAHSLHILCRISGNFDYSPLGDLSGIVCLIV